MPQPNLLLSFLLNYTTKQAFDKESRLIFERNVFYECSEHSGLEVAKFEDILTTLPSSAFQPAPLPSILKSIKSNEKNTSRRVSVGLPVYYDYFFQHNNQDVKKYMADMSHCYRHTSKVAKQEMQYVQTEAEKWANHILHRTGRSVLPTQLHQPFNCCLDPATLEDFDVFINACVELKNEMKHAATTIQCAFRVPPTASSAKLSLWKRLYQDKIKTTATEEKIKPEAKPVIVATKLRVFKQSINSKKNRADRQSALSSIRKNKKAVNLARRRELTAVTSLPIIQAPIRALVSAPSTPIKKKKKKSSITTSFSRPIKLEPAFELVQFISILSECALSSIPEVNEPIEITSILKTWKCKLLPIMEVDEPEEIKEEATTSSDTSETAQPSQLEKDAEAEDIEFGQADEPLVDSNAIPEATPEPIQSPKKLQQRRYKAVESSLDGHYWSVSSTRRRRKSSRVRRQPDFFTPS